MYALVLNDMRASKIETTTIVYTSESESDLLEFLERERVERYVDGQWGKTFRKGGPLEWYNPPYPPGGVVDIGTIEDRVRDLRAKWESEILAKRLP